MKIDIALIVTGVGISIVGGLLTTYLTGKQPLGAIWTGFGTVVLLALTIALYWHKSVVDQRERALEPRFSGRLLPAYDSTPDIPADAFAVQLGDELQVLGKNDYIVLKRFTKPFLEIKISGGELSISATVLTAGENHLVRIIDNEFQASQERAFRPLQPDPHTLVVRDLEGNEALRVRFRNNRVVRVVGRFHVDGWEQPAIIAPIGGLTLPDGSVVNKFTLDLRQAPAGTAFVAFDK